MAQTDEQSWDLPLGGPCSAPWGTATPERPVIAAWQGGLSATEQ